MQDNASIHTARAVKSQFEEHRIPLSNWLLYSLNLNPIKQIQVHLKRKVLKLHLELETTTSNSEEAFIALAKAIEEA